MKRALACFLTAAITAAIAAGPARAEMTPAPALVLTSLATPTAIVPGDSEGTYTYDLRVANLGAAFTDGSDITITDTLPAGLMVTDVEMKLRSFRPGSASGLFDYSADGCEIQVVGESEVVACTISNDEGKLPEAKQPATIRPTDERRVVIHVFAPETMPEGQTLTNHVEVEGGKAPTEAIDVDNTTATFIGEKLQPAPPGLSFLHAEVRGLDGQPAGQAGAHPYQLTIGFGVNTEPTPPGAEAPVVPAGGDLRDVRATLPAGLVGNVNAAKRCTSQQFGEQRDIALEEGPLHGFYQIPKCPEGSAVGLVLVQEIEGVVGILAVPLYSLVPPPGMPAQLGTQILGLPFYFNVELRPDRRYVIVAGPHNLTQTKRLVAATTVIWGAPANERNEPLRGSCLQGAGEGFPPSRTEMPGGCEAPAEMEGEERSFLRLPTNCESPLDIVFDVETWLGASYGDVADHPAMTGCNQLTFEPSLQARPSTDVADSPSGLHFDLHVPQSEDPDGLGTADVRTAVFTLPKGLVLNPSAANGLETCSEAQVGYLGKDGAGERFSKEPVSCPDASRVAEVEVDTPLIDHPLPGSVYIATPHANPFGGLLALYIVVDDPVSGVVVKLAGQVEADPRTGQLTSMVQEGPQAPFGDFKVDFFAGAKASLRAPATCGTYSTTSSMTPWSAPESGPPATPSDTYSIDSSPGGGACATSPGALPNSPSLQAGTVAPIAGAVSPMVIRLSREDGSQEFGSLTLSPPPGLLARLAGIPYCSDSALAAATAKSGNAEKANPSCPAASRVGTVHAAAGAGPAPYWTEGTAYLAGPYKGAPLSLAIITPATAGPYDLGTVLVRTALHVDPTTARITAVSDPIPHILEGIPLDVRQAVIRLDHPGWGINPTSCDPFAFDGQLVSTLGNSVALHSRFQVGECGRLGFKPQLRLKLKGPTRRGAFPQLRATYTAKPGEANLRNMVLRFPQSEFIEQGHFRTICTRVQFAADACPKGSIYGSIRAFTPLLDDPLEGPVYLRSSNHNLPDVVFVLHGQVDAEVAVRIDSAKGGLRARIEKAPDVPLSKVELSMQGGQKGLFVNSRNICARKYRATLQLDAQSGKAFDSKPVLASNCRKGRRHGDRRRR